MLPLLLSFLALAGAADPSSLVAGAGFDVERYRFELRLSESTDSIVGKARVEGRFVEKGRSELVFDLIGRSSLQSAADSSGVESSGVESSGMAVDGASCAWRGSGLEPVTFRQEPAHLVLAFGAPVSESSGVACEIAYHGIPADGLIVDRNRHGERTWFGDNWPDRARHWLPTVDHPRDKAYVEFTVIAPDDYQVISNGALREETDLEGGLRRTRWESLAPLPTKVMVVGVARFAVEHLDPVGGVPLQTWVYREERDEGFDDYGIAARVLPVLVDLVGPFPYAKLANVQSTTRYGGMENAGAIFYSERSVGGERSIEGLFAHEIAHQWFGDAVTETDWAHTWISEGFATYLTQLYFERTVGERRFVEGMAAARDRVVRHSHEHPERTVVDRRPAREMLDANTYQKGAWVLHMLRAEIGDRAFFAGLREIVGRHLHANASSADVRAAFESAAGLDPGALAGFFAQWLERPGQPRLAVAWRRDEVTREVEVTVRQTQEAAPYRAVLDLGLVGADGAMSVHRLRLEDRRTTARFGFVGAPSAVVLDPDVRLLFELDGSAAP